MLAAAGLAGELAIAQTIPPQPTLTDAARRAEEQRKASGPSTEVLTDANLPTARDLDALLAGIEVSSDLFTRYVDARMSIIEWRTRYAPIDEWLLKREYEAGDVLTLEPAYASDRDLLTRLANYRLTPHSYAVADAAFRRGVVDDKLSKKELEQLPAMRQRCVELLRDRNFGDNMSYRLAELENKLDERRKYRVVIAEQDRRRNLVRRPKG